MSIVTKKGDQGMTRLMYNRQVSKCDPRVEAYGSVDEVNSALGLARSTANDALIGQQLLAIQQDLVIIMGELATLPEDRPRYIKDGFPLVTPTLTQKLDALIQQLESEGISIRTWVMPGNTSHSAALDHARTTTRRAERRICALPKDSFNPEILVYLNRLSDALWLLARRAES